MVFQCNPLLNHLSLTLLRKACHLPDALFLLSLFKDEPLIDLIPLYIPSLKSLIVSLQMAINGKYPGIAQFERDAYCSLVADDVTKA